MGLNLLSPPIVEPVSLAELKEFLRIDQDDNSQDSTIAALAVAARAWAETFTGKRFVQQTWRLYMDFFPGYIDLKLAGAKVSSPFVSGSNAVLVGIRYAIALPYPPVTQLVAFNYQNANGQTTSMILGSEAIASVSNPSGQTITLTTAVPHNLVTGAGIIIAGNAPLLALLNGQASQVVTVTGPETIILNGTVGTGSAIAGGGTVTGYNFVQDLQSNPARLTPVFGQMWPVARVVVNAVQVDFQTGLAAPITVTTTANSASITASGYNFQASDVGCAINIPGAAMGTPWGPLTCLNTIIAAVEAGTGNATLRDKTGAAVTAATALLVNAPSANPAHWELIKTAIKFWVSGKFNSRLPMKEVENTAQMILWPTRDLRY